MANDTPFAEFGDALKTLRERARVRKVDLSKALGVAWQTVSRWEAGRMLPPRERRDKIIEALGLRGTDAQNALEKVAAQYADGAPVVVAQVNAAVEPPRRAAEPHLLASALTKAFDPVHHSVLDSAEVVRVLRALRPDIVGRAADPVGNARALLDAAADLREANEPVTVESLAFLACNPSHQKVTSATTKK